MKNYRNRGRAGPPSPTPTISRIQSTTAMTTTAMMSVLMAGGIGIYVMTAHVIIPMSPSHIISTIIGMLHPRPHYLTRVVHTCDVLRQRWRYLGYHGACGFAGIAAR